MRILVNGVQQAALTDIRSFEVAAQFDILREGYLGETVDRRDEIYRGARGRITLHFESEDIFNFTIALINRAARREPDTKINIRATLNFPNGDTPAVLLADCFFGEQPITFGSRSDYGELTLDFETSNFSVL